MMACNAMQQMYCSNTRAPSGKVSIFFLLYLFSFQSQTRNYKNMQNVEIRLSCCRCILRTTIALSRMFVLSEAIRSFGYCEMCLDYRALIQSGIQMQFSNMLHAQFHLKIGNGLSSKKKEEKNTTKYFSASWSFRFSSSLQHRLWVIAHFIQIYLPSPNCNSTSGNAMVKSLPALSS